MVTDRHQGEGEVGGLRRGDIHMPDDLDKIASVDRRSLAEGQGNGLEHLPQQENAEGAAEEGKHDAQLRVGQTQVGEHHVVGADQDIVGDDDLDEDDDEYELLALELQHRQRIGRQGHRNELHRVGGYDDDQRIEVVSSEGYGVPDILEVVQCRFRLWKYGHGVRGFGECRADHPDEGNEPDDAEGHATDSEGRVILLESGFHMHVPPSCSGSSDRS